jgi:hypothetical protein
MQGIGASRDSSNSRDNSNLVVIFLGYGQREYWVPDVKKAILEALKGEGAADFLILKACLPQFLFANPNAIVADMLKLVDDRWTERAGEPYERIILLGYSLGGVLARKFYIAACGGTDRAPLETEFTRTPEEHERTKRQGYCWAGSVKRIVLLAGMNRGWQISYHMSLSRALVWWAGTKVLNLPAWLGLHPLIFSVRRGAQFLTQMRIQWIRMRQEAKERGIGNAMTIQLLGSVDDIVAPEDNIDLIAGRDFYYLDVPHSDHRSIVDICELKHGEGRRKKLIQAMTYPEEKLKAISLLPQDDPEQVSDPGKTDVIFVIHGIRDEGHWTSKIGRKVLHRALKQGKIKDVAIETSSYGFFPMLPLLLSSKRREKVEWFMERYAEAVARYPHATFHFFRSQ